MSYKNNKPEASSEDRRPTQRKSVLTTGIVADIDGTHHFDCTFRNLSKTGALIAVGKTAKVPPEFYLINIRDRIAYEASVVRNNGSEVAVSFLKTLPLSTIKDRSLIFLKKLWIARA